MQPGWSEPAAPPPLTFTERPVERRRLLPVWLGFVLASGGFVGVVVGIAALGAGSARGLYFLFGLPAFVYYFFVINRMIKVLEGEPGWSAEYTPAGVVWKQFIPLYGIFFLYQWTGDVERYINLRTGSSGRAGLLTFLGLFLGFMLRLVDGFLGLFVVFAAFYVLVIPLQKALSVAPPTEEPAPSYSGSLGIR